LHYKVLRLKIISMIKVPTLFTYDKIKDQFKGRKQYENWVFNNLKNNKIRKIRKGLYGLVNPINEDLYANKFEIGCAISETAYLSYHSAIEYYGYSNQGYNELLVESVTEFNDFEFQGTRYICKLVKKLDDVQITYDEKYKVTSLEKTVVDCINNMNLAGGLQELLFFLSQCPKLDEKKLITHICVINKRILYKKCGYLLDIYKENLGLTNHFFVLLSKFIVLDPEYFDNAKHEDNYLDKKWYLIVPKNINKDPYYFLNGDLI